MTFFLPPSVCIFLFRTVKFIVKVDPELNLIAVRGAIPGPKGGLVLIKSTVKTHRVKNVESGISNNPQKASGRNPQKASARTK